MSNSIFSKASIDQAQAISDLVNSAYRGDTSRRGWTTEADLLGGQRTERLLVEEIISQKDSQILVAVRESRLVGCVHLQFRGNYCYLGMLTVDPEIQARGLGSQVLVQAEVTAWRQGSSWIEMTVISIRPELIQWYQNRGYRLSEERRPFPYQDLRFGEPKRQDLEFVVLKKERPS